MVRTSSGVGIVMVFGFLSLSGCQQGPIQVANRPPAPQETLPHLDKDQLADIHLAMGRSLENQGDLDQAAKVYAEVFAQSPKSAAACARLGVVADKQARFGDSAQWHRKALELEPNNADLHCNLGYSLYLQEQWEPAEQELREALRLKPKHARASTNLGLVLARTNRLDEAFAEFRQAGCSEADAHINLAHGLSLAGALPMAQRHYQLALKSDPQSAVAARGLENLQALAARSQAGQPNNSARADSSPNSRSNQN
jgi:Tfp pilus assembly protein PilF